MNKTTSLLLGVVSAALLGACAAPQTDAYKAATEEDTGEGLICENKASVGSRLGKRVCTTAAQREQMAAEAREARDLIGPRGSAPEAGPTPGN